MDAREKSFYSNGKIIMSLGFLSAIKEKSKALKSSDNCLFVIKLKKIEEKLNIDYGFADISKYR